MKGHSFRQLDFFDFNIKVMILLIAALVMINGLLNAQEIGLKQIKPIYSIASVRLGLSSFRHWGINFNPFLRKKPELLLGFGYRHDPDFLKGGECLFGDIVEMGTNIHGPYFMFGYDSKNKWRETNISFAHQIAVKFLYAEDYGYWVSVGGCFDFFGYIGPYHELDIAAKDVMYTFYVDFEGRKRKIDFYLGVGAGVRFLVKEYSIKDSMPTREIEFRNYALLMIDMGMRINWMKALN